MKTFGLLYGTKPKWIITKVNVSIMELSRTAYMTQHLLIVRTLLSWGNARSIAQMWHLKEPLPKLCNNNTKSHHPLQGGRIVVSWLCDLTNGQEVVKSPYEDSGNIISLTASDTSERDEFLIWVRTWCVFSSRDTRIFQFFCIYLYSSKITSPWMCVRSHVADLTTETIKHALRISVTSDHMR